MKYTEATRSLIYFRVPKSRSFCRILWLRVSEFTEKQRDFASMFRTFNCEEWCGAIRTELKVCMSNGHVQLVQTVISDPLYRSESSKLPCPGELDK